MMKIRIAKREDIKEIFALYKRIFSESPYNEKWTKKNLMENLLEIFKKNLCCQNE